MNAPDGGAHPGRAASPDGGPHPGKAASPDGGARPGDDTSPHREVMIDGERLWADLERVSTFGATPAGGLHRLAAGPDDADARAWLRERASEAGAGARVDRVGNMFLRRPGGGSDVGATTGRDPTAGTGPAAGRDVADPRAILVGSHLDSQPSAGRYDGVYGVVAGLAVLDALERAGHVTRHPVELVDWTNEEGARFAPMMGGSSVYAGRLDAGAALASRSRDGLDVPGAPEGQTLAEALAVTGWAGSDVVTPDEHAAYLEAHIEQGPLLEAEGLRVATVTGVQAMCWLEVELTGSPAHAGTFPMESRRDALVAAAQVVTDVHRIGLARPGVGRATVGRLVVGPGSPNVVPGSASLTVELRHPDRTELEAMVAEVREAVDRATRGGVVAEVREISRAEPVTFDPLVTGAVARAAAELGHPPRELVSGAGHDAVQVASRVPTGMLFIPCVGGVSHAEEEAITPEWALVGAEVLLRVVLDLDARLP
ncbi:Zn-dependent hydrolase [Georgenia sp. Z1491]|uniref:Zn-dependent hydrolase n=1 Tax=Georgenia sp. Z1491 TaxID=3416707 RepID=UPI003CEA63B6